MKKPTIIEMFYVLTMALILSSCATSTDNRIIVEKLGVSGTYTPFISTTAGGYIIGIQGNPTGVKLHYKDTDGTTIDVVRAYVEDPAPSLTISPAEK